MAKLLRMGLLLGVMAFAFSSSAHAQGGVMGICTDASWLPGGSSYCTLATSTMDFGTTGDSNPTFNIGLSATSTSSTDLVVLVPNSDSTLSSLSFTATFQLYSSSGTPMGSEMVSSTVYGPTLFSSGNTLLADTLGLTLQGAGDYNFSAVLDHELVPGTSSFTAFYLPTSIQLTSGEYVTVSFAFTSGSGFPYGTIFLALGDNVSGAITQTTPWTTSLQETVPEPMTLSLFGTGLLGIAWLMRRRLLLNGRSEDEGEGTPDDATAA